MGKRNKIDIVEVEPRVFMVIDPVTQLSIGHVMHDDVYTNKWWLYDKTGVKIDGREFDTRAAAVRALVKVVHEP